MNGKHLPAILFPILAGLAACDDFSYLTENTDLGELRWSLDGAVLTKSHAEIPDTNDFILSVRDAKGDVLYEGAYGDSPAHLPVTPGNYTVSVMSVPFSAPAFSRPQYGDSQLVSVPPGESVSVLLCCTMLNSGIRFLFSPSFLDAYPGGELWLRQDGYTLQYPYSETRIAYLMPGDMSAVLYRQGRDEQLLARSLRPREVLTLTLTVPEGGDRIRVGVDSSKTWDREELIVGAGGNSGQTPEEALSVGEAPGHIGENGVWVYGYIVGGDLSAAGKSVKTAGIGKNTHLALAERSSVTEKAACIAVELPKGAIRDALNPADHPELIGRRVCLRGNLVESYFGTLGLKGTSDYRTR